MVGTFHRLLDLNQGFDPKNVLSARVSLPANVYSNSARRLAYYNRALADISRAARRVIGRSCRLSIARLFRH